MMIVCMSKGLVPDDVEAILNAANKAAAESNVSEQLSFADALSAATEEPKNDDLCSLCVLRKAQVFDKVQEYLHKDHNLDRTTRVVLLNIIAQAIDEVTECL